MGKTKTSLEPKIFSKTSLESHDPNETLRDPQGVLESLVECLKKNDLESFQDILIAHLMVVSKTKLSAEAKIGRRTLYDLLDKTKPFNPSLATLGPIFKFIANEKTAS